jgi:hypothetical protein
VRSTALHPSADISFRICVKKAFGTKINVPMHLTYPFTATGDGASPPPDQQPQHPAGESVHKTRIPYMADAKLQ